MWDLPIDSMAQAPTIEQMQQLEKSKAAKVNAVPAHIPCGLVGPQEVSVVICFFFHV